MMILYRSSLTRCMSRSLSSVSISYNLYNEGASCNILSSQSMGDKVSPAFFSTFKPSSLTMEKCVAKVPTMGDSITEGTIVEWTVPIGEAVKEGDVVALIETDKVTVDIKAEMDGIITAQHASIDDNVEVGSNLYEIDTEGAAVPKTSQTESAAKDESSPKISSQKETSPSVRIPSISFLGKDGWLKRKSVTGIETEVTPQSSTVTTPVNDFVNIGAMYGRRSFTEREIEALMLGGASETPEVESGSTGAVFR